ncbi:hypothetical protein D3C85_1898740 [compost metagenome]
MDGLAKAGLNGREGFINRTGEEVIPIKYDAVGEFKNGAAIFRLNGRWGSFDKTGKEITK